MKNQNKTKKEVLENLFSSVVVAKEVKEITGLSYKQIKEWDKKELLPLQKFVCGSISTKLSTTCWKF